ncbi:MAG: ligase-associated DNA damage response endonuclease PdeM [Parcubacteria group bacterium]
MSALPRATYDFAVSPCGGLRLLVNGAEVLMRPSGAVWLESRRALIVADLHFEKGSSYAARGQMLPPYDTRETVSRLEAEVAATDPAVLIFLGDSFHDGKAETRLDADDARRICALASGRTLLWVVGNHDADGPKSLPGDVIDQLTVETLTLRHEPQAGAQPGELAGHLHPSARVMGRGRTVRRRCFVSDGLRVVLPAFGAYAGGLNVRDKAFSGLFATRPLAGALGAGRVHPIGWTSLAPD